MRLASLHVQHTLRQRERELLRAVKTVIKELHKDQHRNKESRKTTLGPVNEYLVISWRTAVLSDDLER